MKKVMFVLVVLLLVSSAFALESGPSNKVGYVKITAIAGSTPFGLPFVFWDVPTGNIPTYGVESRKPSDIIGTQAACGTVTTADRIVQQGGTAPFAYRNSATSCAWAGALETAAAAMTPGRAYWYVNKTGANRTLVLAGEADITGVGIPTIAVNAPSTPTSANNVPYSWRDPRDVPREQLNLLAAGFRGGTISTSDRVTEQGGGARSFYRLTAGAGSWGGTLPSVVPGNAYWIVNKHYGLSAWNYTYLANGSAISLPNDVNFETPTQRIETPSSKAPVSNVKAPSATRTVK